MQTQSEFTFLARHTDPSTSIEAARKVTKEGTVSRHERLICEALCTHGPMTAKEMEARTGLSSVEISRRSTGLMYQEPKRCQYTGEIRGGFKVWGLI